MSMDFFEVFGDAMLSGAMTAFLGVMFIVYLILLLCGIAAYVLCSIGLFTIGKRRGLKYYGLAWVPVCSDWLLGSIADQYDRKAKGKDMRLRLFLLIGEIVCIAAYVVMIVLALVLAFDGGENSASIAIGMTLLTCVTVILVIAVQVFLYIALYKVYYSCTPKNAAWMLVLSILFNVATPICLFVIRNKDEGFVELEKREAEEQTAV